MGERIAIRNRKSGPAHALPLGHTDPRPPWVSTLCGRTLSSPECIPWDSTAPEDRCRTCALRAAEGGADRG